MDTGYSILLHWFVGRPFLAKAEQLARTAKEEADEKLAQEIREADLKQIMAKLEGDLVLLKDRIPSEAKQALETAKDMKYLRDRQQHFAISLVRFRLLVGQGSFHVVNVLLVYIHPGPALASSQARESICWPVDGGALCVDGSWYFFQCNWWLLEVQRSVQRHFRTWATHFGI